jgi:DNA-binding XRE family transcriptional regulator
MAVLANQSSAKQKRQDEFRTCVDCGLTKHLDEYTRIRACVAGWYGRCRACRARREWERNHPGQLNEEWLQREAPDAPVTRVCSDCGLEKSMSEYLPIKACRAGWYGRCRVCRNRPAQERYDSSLEIRAAEIARSTRNRARRQIPVAPAVFIVELFRARRAAGLTQSTLALLAGLAPDTVGRLERGEQRASSPTLEALASALGIAVSAMPVSLTWTDT